MCKGSKLYVEWDSTSCYLDTEKSVQIFTSTKEDIFSPVWFIGWIALKIYIYIYIYIYLEWVQFNADPRFKGPRPRHKPGAPASRIYTWDACSTKQRSTKQRPRFGDLKFFKGPILCCFSSISHSCQTSNNAVFKMHCPQPIRGPEFQLSKTRSSELYWEQAVSVPEPLNANELHLSMPTLPAKHPSQRERMPHALACASRR